MGDTCKACDLVSEQAQAGELDHLAPAGTNPNAYLGLVILHLREPNTAAMLLAIMDFGRVEFYEAVSKYCQHQLEAHEKLEPEGIASIEMFKLEKWGADELVKLYTDYDGGAIEYAEGQARLEAIGDEVMKKQALINSLLELSEADQVVAPN